MASLSDIAGHMSMMGAAEYQKRSRYQQEYDQLMKYHGREYGVTIKPDKGGVITIPVATKIIEEVTDTVKTTVPKKEITMVEMIYNWFKKYSDIIITVAVVFLVDHFAFNGKFRKKIEDLFDALVDKVTAKVAKTDLEK